MAVSSIENLWENIIRRLEDSSAYEILLRDTHLSTKIRSAYNRALSMIGSSIVEALVFLLIRLTTGEEDPVIAHKEENKFVAYVPSAVQTKEKIFFAKKQSTELRLSQSQFEPMIIFLRDKGMLSARDYKTIDKVRRLRNNIHLHKVTGIDRGYDRSHNKIIENATSILIDKIP